MKKTFSEAFVKTIPIIPGYIFMGIAFGILLTNLGYDWYWSPLMALLIYAGMAQFVSINLLVPGVNLLNVFFFQLALNARHMFYGLSLLERFKALGAWKPYAVFALTDETYSVFCSGLPPQGTDPKWYHIFVALLNQSYWVLGCLLGGIAGAALTFDTTGIDFSMTAFFITIVIDQWRDTKDHIPVICGFAVSLGALLLLGAESFIIPALIGITVSLLLFRKRIEEKAKKEVTADAE